ncbi:MAG: HD domain-containing protein [Lachnospiraceae bacterium]|nr:HD domain-containing protein [Lachnospiraceae bacterium]
MKEIVNDRINRILNHDLFIECLAKNESEESDRKFCRHNMGHFLDVARLATIFNLQEQLGIPKDLIYAAALLHDIGRFRQYQDGTPHEQASAELAPEILQDCDYNDKETTVIVEAIRNHRNASIKEEASLNGLLYRADKMSRSCFACPVEKECNWKADKKNLILRY